MTTAAAFAGGVLGVGPGRLHEDYCTIPADLMSTIHPAVLWRTLQVMSVFASQRQAPLPYQNKNKVIRHHLDFTLHPDGLIQILPRIPTA